MLKPLFRRTSLVLHNIHGNSIGIDFEQWKPFSEMSSALLRFMVYLGAKTLLRRSGRYIRGLASLQSIVSLSPSVLYGGPHRLNPTPNTLVCSDILLLTFI